jgi:hypothetical protein
MASGALSAWLADLSHSVSLADPQFVGIGIAALSAAGAAAAWTAWRGFYRTRLIEDMPTSKARSAAQGYVELEGRGRLIDGAPVVAPLSGLPCVWFRYKVEEQVTVHNPKGPDHHSWRVVEQGESEETFWLEDDTGRVVVDPSGAEVTPAHVDVWRTGMFGSSSPLRSDFVVNFTSSRSGGNPHRFTEWRINPGEEIFALGLLKNLGSHLNPATLEDDVRQLLREWKQDQAKLKERFDLDRDGKISDQEWMLARAQARRDAQKARRQQMEKFADGLNLLGRTGDRSRPFLLSAHPQSRLARRYRWQAILGSAGFFAAGALALWLFNTRFGG